MSEFFAIFFHSLNFSSFIPGWYAIFQSCELKNKILSIERFGLKLALCKR